MVQLYVNVSIVYEATTFIKDSRNITFPGDRALTFICTKDKTKVLKGAFDKAAIYIMRLQKPWQCVTRSQNGISKYIKKAVSLSIIKPKRNIRK